MSEGPPRKIGPFTVHSDRRVFANPWIDVHRHHITLPDGNPGEYGVVRFRNRAIGVLPLFADGTTILVGQHRFPFDAPSWELPEGGGPKNEDPANAAARELREETGLRAASWAPLGTAHLSNSVTDEVAHYYLAWDLTEGEAAPDGTEVLDYRRVSLGTVMEEVLSGAITDSLTHLIVLTAAECARRDRLPLAVRDLILRGL